MANYFWSIHTDPLAPMFARTGMVACLRCYRIDLLADGAGCCVPASFPYPIAWVCGRIRFGFVLLDNRCRGMRTLPTVSLLSVSPCMCRSSIPELWATLSVHSFVQQQSKQGHCQQARDWVSLYLFACIWLRTMRWWVFNWRWLRWSKDHSANCVMIAA